MAELADPIIEGYLRSVKWRGDYVSSICPFHRTEDGRPFWVHRITGAWGCFSCGIKGVDLRSLMENLGVRNSKLEVELEKAKERSKKTHLIEKVRKRKKALASFTGVSVLPESLLGVYDWEPTPLIQQGFSREVLEQHDIGYDKKNNRLTFPIRDIQGSLIGISGRALDGSEPKYRVYSGKRVVDDKIVYGELGKDFPEYSSTDIRNHLWRGHFVYEKLFQNRESTLVIVEGYKAAMWLVQLGWANTVAIMGAHLSRQQERVIKRMGTPTWVLLDNNFPGRRGSIDACRRLANSTFPVFECCYPSYKNDSAQPDDLDPVETEWVFATARRVGGTYR